MHSSLMPGSGARLAGRIWMELDGDDPWSGFVG
jgi:hypothetical protein